MDKAEIKKRMNSVGEDGKFVSLVTGNETDQELREITVCLIRLCHSEPTSRDNPYLALSYLSWQAFHHLVENLARKDLLELLEQELEARNRSRNF